MSNGAPDFIVHYSRGEPFRSITSLGPDAVDVALKNLNETTAWGLARFSDPRYLLQRYQAEELLREQFIRIGGKPVLKNPIYFFLGRHSPFEEDERNLGSMISLREIDPLTVSFSYGDSMFCFNEDNRSVAGEKYQNPLCDELYSLESLPGLFAHPNFRKAEPLHIEAHLWVAPDPASVRRLAKEAVLVKRSCRMTAKHCNS